MSESNLPKHSPVIIVGAGPTGLVAALELTRQGLAVRILDMAAKPNGESRGTGLQARTLELLNLYGVTDEILSRANMAKAFVTYHSGKEAGRIDFTLTPSRYAGAPALPQAVTESILRDRLLLAGVRVEYGIEVIEIEQHDDRCVVHATGPGNSPIEFTASWIIGADGSRSPVRNMLDLPFDGVSYPEGWGLMDATLDWSLSSDDVRIFRGEGPQQFVAVPLGGASYRLQIDHRDPSVQGEPPTIEEMQKAFDAVAPVTGKISQATWRSSFRLHRRQVVAYRKGRVLLAGDAAHIHTPAGAQGLNTGIQDAINLGWKLALVASGRAGEALLDSYQEERKPIAAGVLQLSEMLARNPLALLGDGSVPAEMLSARVGQLLVNYRDGPLGQAADEAGSRLVAGDRLPDIMIGGEALYDRLRPGGITVLIFGRNTDTTVLQAEWAGSINIWNIDADDPDGSLSEALGIENGAAVVRPDGYLGLVVESLTPSSAIDAWLVGSLHLVAARTVAPGSVVPAVSTPAQAA